MAFYCYYSNTSWTTVDDIAWILTIATGTYVSVEQGLQSIKAVTLAVQKHVARQLKATGLTLKKSGLRRGRTYRHQRYSGVDPSSIQIHILNLQLKQLASIPSPRLDAVEGFNDRQP